MKNLPIARKYSRGKYAGRLISNALGTAQEQFKESLVVYTGSLAGGQKVKQYMEGNHYSDKQIAELKTMRRIAESYNVLLKTKRQLAGYFDEVVTTAIAKALKPDETVSSLLHNEMYAYTKRISKWDSKRTMLINDLLDTGLCVPSLEVIPTEEKDDLGRTIFDVKIQRKDPKHYLLDSKSKEPDYSDAKWIAEWSWESFDTCVDLYGRAKVGLLQSDHSDYQGDLLPSTSEYRQYQDMNNFQYWTDGQDFLIIKTFTKAKDGSISIIHWHGDLELKTEYIDARTFPQIPITLLRESETNAYYSLYRELIPSQDAINQALLQFQLLINSNRVIVDNTAITDKDLASFAKKVKMVNEVLQVKKLTGVRIDSLSADARMQIDRLHTSIQFIMDTIGINEAFGGQSKAGDSGRKFEGQRSASESTLKYIFTPINLMHEELLRKTIHYNSVYKQATEAVRFLSDFNQERWVVVNEPFFMPTGNINDDGSLEVEPIKKEIKNKNTGNWEVEYVNEKAMTLRDIAIECEIYTAPYNDTDEIERVYLESMLNGITGQLLANSSPASVLYIQGLLTKHMKTRNSEKVAKMLDMMAQQLGQFNVEDPRLYINGGMQGGSTSGEGISNTSNNSGKMLDAGGMTNDNQQQGYNAPTGGQ